MSEIDGAKDLEFEASITGFYTRRIEGEASSSGPSEDIIYHKVKKFRFYGETNLENRTKVKFMSELSKENNNLNNAIISDIKFDNFSYQPIYGYESCIMGSYMCEISGGLARTGPTERRILRKIKCFNFPENNVVLDDIEKITKDNFLSELSRHEKYGIDIISDVTFSNFIYAKK